MFSPDILKRNCFGALTKIRGKIFKFDFRPALDLNQIVFSEVFSTQKLDQRNLKNVLQREKEVFLDRLETEAGADNSRTIKVN